MLECLTQQKVGAAVEKLSRLNSKILHISQISSRDNENNFEDSQEKTLSRNYYKPMQWSWRPLDDNIEYPWNESNPMLQT